MIPPTSTFDKNNEVYMCCCGSCHITTGAMIVAILEIIRSSAAFIYGCVLASQYGYATILISSIVYTGLSITACALFFVGVKQERASFAIMLMVMQILHIIGLGIGLIISIIVLVTGTAIIGGFVGVAIAVFWVLVAVQGVFICLDIWFFTIVNRAHRYLKALECHHHAHMPQVQYAAYPPGVMVAGGQPVMTVGVQMPYVAGQPYYAQPQYGYPQQQPQYGYPQQQPQFAPQGTANPAPGPYQPYAEPPKQTGF